MNRPRLILLIAAVSLVVTTTLYLQRQPEDGIWRFNFAPDSAPAVAGFRTVSAASDYSRWRGFGWRGVEGPVEAGKWPGDTDHSWESRRHLNLISRRGPDALARSFAAGPASFVLDLDPGRYEVWVLSGDAGHLEYSPYEAYRIRVEGKTAYSFDTSAGDFIQRFETPPHEDELSHSDIWQQSIAPRFKWSRVVVDVTDGQLTVSVDGQHRDRSIQALMGEYAHTEIREGPAVRYSGALNALVVLPATADGSRGRQLIGEIDAWRRQDIARQWPRRETSPGPVPGLTAADRERGYTVSPVNVLSPVLPDDRYAHSEAVIKLRATPGESVPVTFAVTPLQDLGETRVRFDWLQGADTEPAPADIGIDTGVVRYIARPVKPQGRAWRPGPGMIVPTDHWKLRKGISKQFWLTLHVPEDLSPGRYTGSIGIRPSSGDDARIGVELQVLPFSLARPDGLAIGMTYFSPVQHALTGEADFWRRMQAEFADMRAHNMTTVQYTGIRMDDYARMERAFTLYREAGFEQPVNLLESYGALVRWRRQGIPWTDAGFQTQYVQLVRDFLEEARRRDWPPVIIDFGDEFTNSATEETGARIARRLKQIPGIVTAADVNGYKELHLLAPEVDIIAFNNGWDGPAGVNKGRRLLNKATVDEVLAAGAIPWLVNIGMDRFSNGYWLWKMARLGVRGKMEWMYRGYNGMPYNNFDAQPLHMHAVYPGPAGTVVPSLDYEWLRIGLDDLAYLNTLEQVLEHVRDDPEKRMAVKAAEAFIEKLDGMIEVDMVNNRDKRGWPVEHYEQLRNEITDLVLLLAGP